MDNELAVRQGRNLEKPHSYALTPPFEVEPEKDAAKMVHRT